MAPSRASFAASAPAGSANWISAMPLLFLVVLQAWHNLERMAFSQHLSCWGRVSPG